MNSQVQYRLELLKESMQISGQLLLIRLHLKKATQDERNLLNIRADCVRTLIQESK